LDKIDDVQSNFYPNNKSANDTRHKLLRSKSNHITVDSLPINQLTRSNINDRIQSTKGKYIFI
jgi:hypothetical protein